MFQCKQFQEAQRIRKIVIAISTMHIMTKAFARFKKEKLLITAHVCFHSLMFYFLMQ